MSGCEIQKCTSLRDRQTERQIEINLFACDGVAISAPSGPSALDQHPLMDLSKVATSKPQAGADVGWQAQSRNEEEEEPKRRPTWVREWGRRLTSSWCE